MHCHGGDDPDGGLDLTGIRGDDGMVRSYRHLFGQRSGSTEPGPSLVSVSNRFSNAAITRPKEFGSHKSRLTEVLLKDELHQEEVVLNREQWIALVTWIDLNAPYYDTFFNRRPTDGDDPRRDVYFELPDPFATVSPVAETAKR